MSPDLKHKEVIIVVLSSKMLVFLFAYNSLLPAFFPLSSHTGDVLGSYLFLLYYDQIKTAWHSCTFLVIDRAINAVFLHSFASTCVKFAFFLFSLAAPPPHFGVLASLT